MMHAPVIHLPCGTLLRVANGAGGHDQLECKRCGTVGILAHPPVRLSDEATADNVVYYLAEHYDIDLLDAVAVVRRHLATVFARVDGHRAVEVVGDELAAAAGLPRKP